MTTRSVSKPARAASARTPTEPESPIDIIDEALAQARATLDLIYGLTVDTTGIALSSLDPDTLGRALTGATGHIDAATAAAKRLHAGQGTARRGAAP